MKQMEHISTRTLDGLGRIVLPNEIRSKLEWGEGDTFSMYYVDGNTLMLQLSEKYMGKKCIFCGAKEAIALVQGKDVCAACTEKIKAS